MKTKSLINSIVAAITLAGIFAGPSARAQTVIADWNPSGLANSGPSPWAPATNNPNLIIGGLTRGSGVTNTTTANVWGANGWNLATPSEANAIAANKFVTFSFQPNPGYTLSLSSISDLFVRKSATGPAFGELQYSTDGTNFTDLFALAYGLPGVAVTPTAGTNDGPINLSGISALQNITSATTVTFRFVNWGSTNGQGAGTWYIADGNSGSDFQILGTVTSSGVGPMITGISPSSISTNFGATVSYTVTATGDPATYFWYQINSAGITNLLDSQTNATLTLTNVTAGDDGDYFVVLSNATSTATSSQVSLSVADPAIILEPVSQPGLLGGAAQFPILAVGSGLTYQWYFADTNGNPTTMVNDGALSSGAIASGATSSTLMVSNLTFADPTNFLVVVTGTYGSLTSSVASLTVSSHTALAFWDFDGLFINTNNPATYYGIGNATAVGGVTNFLQTLAANLDGNDNPPLLLNPPNYAWGSSAYPASGSNKLCGVQFNASTAGAKNITVSFDCRATGTASEFLRLQYTADGINWIDFPTSSNFGGNPATTTGNAGSSLVNKYQSFSYSLAGFPGADNNPNFGIRLVTEFQSTALYGASANANYIGMDNTYGTGATISYDLVTISGDAITNNNQNPEITLSITNGTTDDFIKFTNDITLVDNQFGTGTNITVSAHSLNQSVLQDFEFSVSGTNASRELVVTPQVDDDGVVPVLVTADDGLGDIGVTWFYLAIQSVNLAPTNSLTALTSTNMPPNSSITIPFNVTDDRTPSNGQSFTYTETSDNNTLIPTGNIVIGGSATNPTVTITPAANQLGSALISVTVSDNDLLEPRSTTANITVSVLPNTNVVLIDYFDYDGTGALSVLGGGLWKHLSGNAGQMQVGSGVVTIDTEEHTENLQAKLGGAPYVPGSGAVLYASFSVSMMDSTELPVGAGTYFAVFNDGSGVTGLYENLIYATTNGAALGKYRIGIANSTNTTADGVQYFPQDLSVDNSYTVVTRLDLNTGLSTLWINPSDESSPGVTDTTADAQLLPISDFELRESGSNAGAVSLSTLKIGTTFDSVLPSLHINLVGSNAVLTSSDPTLGVQSSTNVDGPYTDVSPNTPFTNSITGTGSTFYHFGQ